MKCENSTNIRFQDSIERIIKKIKSNQISKQYFRFISRMFNYYHENEKITPLQIAIEKNLIIIVTILLECDVKLTFPNGDNVINVIAKTCSIKILDDFGKEFDLFATNKMNQNAIHSLTESISENKIEFLDKYYDLIKQKSIKLKDLFNKKDEYDNYPIQKAVLKDDVAVAKWIISKDLKQLTKKLDSENNSFFHLIAKTNSLPMLDMIINNKFNVFDQGKVTNKKNQNVLHIALSNSTSSLDFIKKLIQFLTDKNQNLNDYLHEADKSNFIPLFYAIKNNNISIFEYLFERIKPEDLNKLSREAFDIGFKNGCFLILGKFKIT